MAVSNGEMAKQKSIAANMLAKGMASELIEELVSERGLPKTDGVIWADTGDEEPEAIEMTVSSFWNADGSGLVLHAECSIGNQKESASMILKRERLSVYTPSDADRKEKTEDEP